MLDKFLIGEIVSVHGVKGALKVRPLTDHPVRFTKLDEVKVILPKNSPKGVELTRTYKVISAIVSGGFVLLRLYGIDDRDQAELYRGAMLEIPREKAIDLPEDSYFIGDLIGCQVMEELEDGTESLLGKVTDVLQTGGNDVYQVMTPDKIQMLLPAIKQVVRHVDVEQGIIHVRMLPGLKEVYLNNDNNDEN